jgi:hypothetical protein
MTRKANAPRVAPMATALLLEELKLTLLLGGLFGSVVVELEVELGGRKVGLVRDLPVCEFVGVVWVGGKGSNKETKDWEELLYICNATGAGPLLS